MAHRLNRGGLWQTEALEAGRKLARPSAKVEMAEICRFHPAPVILETALELGRTGANRGKKVGCPSAPVRGVYNTPHNWVLTGAIQPTRADCGSGWSE